MVKSTRLRAARSILSGPRLAVSAVLICSAVTLSVDAADRPAPTTKGFAVSRFVQAFYVGDNECPEGLAEGPSDDSVLANLPAAEQKRLKQPENYMELQAVKRHRAKPYGPDVCQSPRFLEDPGFRTVQGKIALGLNLDDSDQSSAGGHTCTHENFTGLSGELGIDNQLYRALGCIKGQRPRGLSYELLNAFMRQGDHTILIELRGVDDLQNDDNVEVGFYSSGDALPASVEGVILTNASLSVMKDRHYQSHTRGKIVDGILTTQPVDVRLETSNSNFLPEYNFRDARVRLELKPDGTARGVLGGYAELSAAYLRVATFGEESTHGPLQCPGVFHALRRLADGYRDRNGDCTWISAAYEVEAVPAFVIHPRD